MNNTLFVQFIPEYRRLFDRVVSLTHLNLHRLELGSQSWGQQFKDAMSVNGGDLENATTIDYVMHFLTFAWKVHAQIIFIIHPSGHEQNFESRLEKEKNIQQLYVNLELGLA